MHYQHTYRILMLYPIGFVPKSCYTKTKIKSPIIYSFCSIKAFIYCLYSSLVLLYCQKLVYTSVYILLVSYLLRLSLMDRTFLFCYSIVIIWFFVAFHVLVPSSFLFLSSFNTILLSIQYVSFISIFYRKEVNTLCYPLSVSIDISTDSCMSFASTLLLQTSIVLMIIAYVLWDQFRVCLCMSLVKMIWFWTSSFPYKIAVLRFFLFVDLLY